jgi:hypothetical protein
MKTWTVITVVHLGFVQDEGQNELQAIVVFVEICMGMERFF